MSSSDMRGTRFDQKWTQGDRVEWQITVKSEGSPLDITGYTVEGSMARSPGGTPDATFTVTLTDPTNGIVTLTLLNAVTSGLSGTYWYDVQYETDTAVGPFTIYWGQWSWQPEVTT